MKPVRYRILAFLCAFAFVFASLALARGPGPYYSKAHAALANALFGRKPLTSGVRLRFDASDEQVTLEPWRVTMHVEATAPRMELNVPIDVRSLLYLPTAAFLALAIAVPLDSTRAHLRLIACGLLLLEPLLLVLVASPLLSFLGGTGPIHAFTLSRPTHVVLQILYRALVAPPGMAYALPLLLWWVLIASFNRNDTRKARARNSPLVRTQS